MGWRSKFIFVLLVYFAGFATAIYTLGPTPQNLDADDVAFPATALESDEFAHQFNDYMHHYVQAGKQVAQRAGEYIKQKIAEMQVDS